LFNMHNVITVCVHSLQMRLAVSSLLILIELLHQLPSTKLKDCNINSGLDKEKLEALKALQEWHSGGNTVVMIMGPGMESYM